MKEKIPIGIYSSKRTRSSMFLFGEEADIKMIVHVADAVENDL